MTTIPLCVDLDGTLIRPDTLWISMRQLLLSQPWTTPLLAGHFLFRGRSGMKSWMAGCTLPDPGALPYHLDFVEWLDRERMAGRRLLLVTGAHQRIANAVAQHVGGFDDVLATSAHYNMSGAPKAAALVERFGRGGFDYAGNSRVDIPVWQAARRAIVVNAPESVSRFAHSLGNVECEFQRPLRVGALADLRRNPARQARGNNIIPKA